MATIVTNQHKATNFTYEDSEFTRKKEGVELPMTTPEQISSLNQGFPWETWGGIRLSKCRCFFVRPNGTMILFSTIRRVLGGTETPCRSVLPYLSIPNGQVKNFLNACRAVAVPKDQMRIAVVGSKSLEGGGAWHQYFCKYLQMYAGSYIVDFYDYAEIPDNKVFYSDQSFVSAEWIQAPFEKEALENYDLVIDDAWTIEQGPGLSFHGKEYSLKGKRDGSVPFLHETEHRTFSRPPQKQVQAGCRCSVCRVIKESVLTFEEYLYLRQLSYRLGYQVPCEGTGMMEDLKGLSKIYYDLLSQPTITIQRQDQLRYLISLSEEIGIEYKGAEARRRGEAVFKDFSRYKKQKEITVEKSVPYFEYHSVIFAGVSPSILGGTKISKGPPEILFVNSIDTWRTQVAPPIVYCQASVHDVERLCPQYKYSGRMYIDYREYIRRAEGPVTKLVKQKALQSTQYTTHLPAEVFHKVEVDRPLQKSSPPKKDFILKTLEIDRIDKSVRLKEFDPAHWRTSIYLNVDGTYGPIKKVLAQIGVHTGFLQAKFPLPWDMTTDEVLSLENDEEYDRLRENVSNRKAPESLRSEWVRQKKKKYIRSEQCHPVSWHYFENMDEEILHYRQTYGYLEGLVYCKKYLERMRVSYGT
jgi:hypothetical protein